MPQMNSIIDEFHLFKNFYNIQNIKIEKTDSVHHPHPKLTGSGLGIEYRGKISSQSLRIDTSLEFAILPRYYGI